MSKKPEIKIYPDYNFGVKFPNGWREDPINPPTRLHSIKKYQENSQALKNWIDTSVGWPQVNLDQEKKRTIYKALKAMLKREPEAQDLEKVEELGYNGNISMICYDEKPIGFCEWYGEGETLFVFITPTKYFKDEKS